MGWLQASERFRPIGPVLILLILVGGIATSSGVFAQGEAGKPIRQGEGEKALVRQLRKMRTVYMDVYPLYRTLKNQRSSESGQKLRRRVKEQMRNQSRDRLRSISNELDRLEKEGGPLGKEVRTVRKEVYRKLVTFINRALKDWRPEHPRRVRRMTLREKIKNDVAGPEILRRYFLSRLAKHLLRLPTPRRVIKERIDRLESQLDPLYWSMLNRYIELLEKVEKARSRRKEKKKKNKSSDETASAGNANASDENGNSEAILKEVKREWNQFIEKKREKLDRYLNRLNRIVSLYRGREYLYNNERKVRRRALSLKRRMGTILRLRNRDAVFAETEKVKKTLVRHGKMILRTYSDFLLGENWPGNAFQRMSERPGLQGIKRDHYDALVDQYELELKNMAFGDVMAKCRRISEHVQPIAKRLKEYGTEEKRTGELLLELHRIARVARRRLKQDIRATRLYFETFREMTFTGPDAFQKKFRKRIERLQKKIYGTTKKRPQPSGQQLQRRLRSLRDRVNRTLDEPGG